MKERLFIALAAFSGTVTMCSSFAVMLIVNVPLARATKKYLQYSAVMLGYSSVDEFADTNSLLVDAEQLFPKGSIELANLKLLSAISIEDCILMAASLSCQSGSVLKSTFYKMLRGKTELLYPVESYIYEDGLGLSGWIENKRVLLGTRELMENHSIDGLPSEAKEKEYTNGNVAVYLSISGITAAMFVIQVSPNLSVTRWLQELELEGITTVIRTVDGFLSQRFLSDLFDIESDSVKLLSFRYHKDYESETEYVPRQASSMLCSGHFPSFAMLVIGAKRLKFTADLGASVMYGATILAALIALIMMLAGSFVQLTPTLVIVYNLIVTGVALLIQHIKKL
jgi:Cu+-exporting ATPase